MIKPNGLWVYCEQHDDILRDVALELLGKAAELAQSMQTEVTAVYLGSALRDETARRMAECGADQILCVEDAELAQPDELRYTDELEALVKKYSPAAFLLGATAFGRSLSPRLAARLETGLTADCTGLDIDPETGMLLQTRPAFGGHLMATIICPESRPQMATVRPKVFAVPNIAKKTSVPVLREKASGKSSPIKWIEKLARAEDINIGDADVLVSVGQGIGNAENIALAEKLAQRLHGQLSASRPMVDSGMIPYARQVGQTGKTVSPKLYIALGISGAVQHMAGVATDNIVAVNTDPEAPIFSYSKYAVVADCGAFLRELLEKLG